MLSRTLRRRLLLLAIALLAVLLLRMFVADVVLVVESSMWPSLSGGRDRVLLNRLAAQPGRFEVWAYEQEREQGGRETRIKRVLALAGEVLALRGGDVFVGAARDSLRRAPRTPEQIESMRIRLPGPGAGEAARWKVLSGTADVAADGTVNCRGDAFEAVILGSLGPGTESVMDDFLSADGLVHPGRHVVPDTRLSVVLFPAPGELILSHALDSGVRGVRVRGGQLLLCAVDETPLCEVPAQGLPLTIETLDGRFRVMTEQRVLHESERETAQNMGISLWKVSSSGGAARLRAVDLSRDVHYFFSGGLSAVTAYQVCDNACFAAGDNQPVSSDSRSHGPVPHALLTGRAECILLPRMRSLN